MGVAATKSYINQVLVLLLLGIFISQKKDTSTLFRKHLIENITDFANNISIPLYESDIDTISSRIYESSEELTNQISSRLDFIEDEKAK